MSIYTQCGEAARKLLDDPTLRIATSDRYPAGVFTELDVIFLAARDAGMYTSDQMREAQREASQVMGTLFRNRSAVRYGPVTVEGLKDPDYVRLASKIVYSSPEGPPKLHTPNGLFPKMFTEQDVITRQGRRLGANRDDFEAWNGQDILDRGGTKVTADQREIMRLSAEVAALRHQLAEAQSENHRLRAHHAQSITAADVEEIVERKLRVQS